MHDLLRPLERLIRSSRGLLGPGAEHASSDTRRQQARELLRLKLEVLHARYHGNEARIRKIRHFLKKTPAFQGRHAAQIEKYLGRAFEARTRIRREARRLVDFPERIEYGDGLPKAVTLRHRGRIEYREFIRLVERGDLPVFTIRTARGRWRARKLPVLVPWARLAEELMDISRHDIEHARRPAR